MGRLTAHQSSEKSGLRRDLLICAALVVVTWGVYLPACQFEFVDFDDNAYVFKNYHVKQGLSLESLRWGLTSRSGANWHPLTWYSLMLDATLFGENAGGFHFTSILFHSVNTLLLYVLLKRMTGAAWNSAVVSALFAIHPLHVESVAWVSERKDVLSLFFGLLTMLAYCRYVREGSWKIYAAGLVSFFLSLASKQMFVTLPFLMLLLDYWPLKRTRWLMPDDMETRTEPQTNDAPRQKHEKRNKKKTETAADEPPAVTETAPLSPQRLLIEKVPYLLVTLIFSGVAYMTQSSGGTVATTVQISLPTRIANAVLVYGLYLWKTLWPVGLGAFYPHPQESISMGAVAVAALILIAMTVFVVLQWRRRPYLLVGWFWYLGTLVPVIGIVQIGMQQMADRYTYFPLIGFFVAVVWYASSLIIEHSRHRAWAWGGVLVLLISYMVLAREQVNTWHDSLTLFNRALAVTKDNAYGHYMLGLALKLRDRPQDAMSEYQKCLAIDPRFAKAHVDMGVALYGLGHVKEAVTHFETALELDPKASEAHVNMGVALFQVGLSQEGFRHLEHAVKLDPENVNAQINMGNALETRKQFDEALEHFRRAAELDPENWLAHFKVGERLLARGELDMAERELRTAVQFNSKVSDAYTYLGTVAVKRGNSNEAAQLFRRALELNPQDRQARQYLQQLRPR